jgi:hypothetical protein
MRRVSMYAVLALLLCAFLSPSQSRADGVDDFTLSDGLGNTITWQLPASPAPLGGVNPGSAFDPGTVTVTVDGIAELINPIFFNLTAGGGVDIQGILPLTAGPVQPQEFLAILSGASIGANAPQLYSGSESAPTFLTGTFLFVVETLPEAGAVPPVDTNGTLTITPDVTAVPEPSALTLLGAGLFGMGAILLGKLR